MVARWGGARNRFFGVGMAVAAELDKAAETILSAPGFRLARPGRRPRALPRTSGCAARARRAGIRDQQGRSRLRGGPGSRKSCNPALQPRLWAGNSGQPATTANPAGEFGRVLTQARASDASGRSLSELCGGVSVLAELYGATRIATLPAREQARMLSEALNRVPTDAALRELLRRTGEMTAHQTVLVFDLFRPERILLAGPLAQAEPYFAGFCSALQGLQSGHARPPEIMRSDMTPTGASRWLALRSNVSRERLAAGRPSGRNSRMNRRILLDIGVAVLFLALGVVALFILIPGGVAVPGSVMVAALAPDFWPRVIAFGSLVCGSLPSGRGAGDPYAHRCPGARP